MKKVIVVLGILLFSLVGTSQAQIRVERGTKNKIVFWFNVKITIRHDRETGLPYYAPVRMGKRVYSGTMKEYEQRLWYGMSHGAYLTIGPFNEFQNAKKAMLIYDFNKNRPDSLPIDYQNPPEIYWFLVKINIMPRSKAYKFERLPAAVASGSIRDFQDMLHESLSWLNLAIGPFVNYEDAEEAKRIYRLEE